ncbi:hypothetical protein L1987_42402 [Smallanthus sonchifolius]|uniref:Uncharacterized protein n=1 Tax=Smallanthus sonchifolius TaxID=185202 RepID=A0ACB9GI84_9ASTR|nr:hypothetical protein L1987_42402 [Smallanthus sonchifolius]
MQDSRCLPEMLAMPMMRRQQKLHEIEVFSLAGNGARHNKNNKIIARHFILLGFELRKDGFDLAESRYKELKPILDEIE